MEVNGIKVRFDTSFEYVFYGFKCLEAVIYSYILLYIILLPTSPLTFANVSIALFQYPFSRLFTLCCTLLNLLYDFTSFQRDYVILDSFTQLKAIAYYLTSADLDGLLGCKFGYLFN